MTEDFSKCLDRRHKTEDYIWLDNIAKANFIIQQKIGEPTYVRFDAEEEKENPIEALKRIPVKDRFVIMAAEDPAWGGIKSQEFRSEILINPTWLELAVVCHQQIKTTLDLTHIFLESIVADNVAIEIDNEYVKIYHFFMGS